MSSSVPNLNIIIHSGLQLHTHTHKGSVRPYRTNACASILFHSAHFLNLFPLFFLISTIILNHSFAHASSCNNNKGCYVCEIWNHSSHHHNVTAPYDVYWYGGKICQNCIFLLQNWLCLLAWIINNIRAAVHNNMSPEGNLVDVINGPQRCPYPLSTHGWAQLILLLLLLYGHECPWNEDFSYTEWTSKFLL